MKKIICSLILSGCLAENTDALKFDTQIMESVTIGILEGAIAAEGLDNI